MIDMNKVRRLAALVDKHEWPEKWATELSPTSLLVRRDNGARIQDPESMACAYIPDWNDQNNGQWTMWCWCRLSDLGCSVGIVNCGETGWRTVWVVDYKADPTNERKWSQHDIHHGITLALLDVMERRAGLV